MDNKLLQLNGQQLSNEQVALIKDQIAVGVTDMELAYYLQVADRMQLDPFRKQIYAIKRKSGGVDKMTIQVSIDGYRSIAAKDPNYQGTKMFWCGKDGAWKDVWLEDGNPAAAKCVLFLATGQQVEAIALWKEYCQQYDNKPGAMWTKMPAHMLSKCAEALALRKAFPDKLAGTYTSEELQQATVEVEARDLVSDDNILTFRKMLGDALLRHLIDEHEYEKAAAWILKSSTLPYFADELKDQISKLQEKIDKFEAPKDM